MAKLRNTVVLKINTSFYITMWKWGEGCIGRGLPVGLDQLVWKGAGEDGTIGLEVCIEAREGGLLQHHPPLGHLLLQQAGWGGGH
jgi:hypothetical protein